MKAIILVILGSALIFKAHSQSHLGDSWEIGASGYSINFTQVPPSHDSLIVLYVFGSGKSNISDSSGNMLIMSTGWDIFNKYGQLIENGDTMTYHDIYDFYNGGVNCPQSSIFLPKGDSNTFYFINPGCNDTCFNNQWLTLNYKAPMNMLYYSIVDMNANGGLGKVTQKMIPIVENQDLSKEGMMACRHGNGKDWWLLKAAADSNNFFVFLFTADSVLSKGIQRLPHYSRGYRDQLGQMVFNSTGDQLAFVGSGKSELYLYDFDRCYGKLSNFRKVEIPMAVSSAFNDTLATGVAYSPNGRFIYVTKWSYIFQYDTQDSIWYQVADWDTAWNYFSGYNTCLLGPDQKIYIGYYHGISKEFSVIDNPDNKGVACNFCRKCMRSKSVNGFLTTPPCMPNYNLGAKICWPDGVSEVTTSSFAVIPNPSSGRITVKGDDYLKEIKYIFDATGNLIQTTRHNNIDFGSLPKGVYFLKCREKTTKVLIQ